MQAKKPLVVVFALGIVLTYLLGPLYAAEEGAVSKVEIFPGYCHMRFPAMEERSLGTTRTLMGAATSDVIDFYGPCDYDPRGPEEWSAQKFDKQMDVEGESR